MAITSRIYLDHAATTPLCEAAKKAMRQAMDRFGNPSSLHNEGRAAKETIDTSREAVSEALGCLFAEVIFTGSGTESANLALIGAALANEDPRRTRVLVSSVEHHCVLHTAPILRKLGYEPVSIPVRADSEIDLDALEALVDERTLIVSAMHANNETGRVQPVREIAQLAHHHGALYHCDATQTFLKASEPLPVSATGDDVCDLLTVSFHKVNGPKGVGSLYVRGGVKVKPFVSGGEQERELRGGTENLIGIAGAGAAVRDHLKRPAADLSPLKSVLINALSEAGFEPSVADGRGVLSGHVHGRFPGLDAETLLIRLDRAGIAASSGAACSSGSIEPSHVMLACGYSETEAKESVRFTLGEGNSLEQMQEASEIILKCVRSMRESRAVL
jgi:cysteine desulfurase